jgi:alpha-tubulin suppressor-like RCC1 family protein
MPYKDEAERAAYLRHLHDNVRSTHPSGFRADWMRLAGVEAERLAFNSDGWTIFYLSPFNAEQVFLIVVESPGDAAHFPESAAALLSTLAIAGPTATPAQAPAMDGLFEQLAAGLEQLTTELDKTSRDLENVLGTITGERQPDTAPQLPPGPVPTATPRDAAELAPPAITHAIAAGGAHSLAIRSDGTLWAWGFNKRGQLGDGTTTHRHSPVQVLTDVVSVAAGYRHSLAIRSDGTLWAWGSNKRGQLGDGTTTHRHSPVQVLTDVVSVTAGGGSHSLAIRRDGTLWAWGWNKYGQLGDGTTTDRHSPVQVLTNVVSVTAGIGHSLAIRRDGTLWAWGFNEGGQLGDGTWTGKNRPVQVLMDVVSVEAGWAHSLAIRRDGTLWAWGANEGGQLGDGTTTNRHSPVQVLTDVVSVTGGDAHSLAIRRDGTLWAWGANESGQLGDGTWTGKNRPVQVLTDIVSVEAGGDHSLAISRDGTLGAWGWNKYGQLGDGATTERHRPVQVLAVRPTPLPPTEVDLGENAPGKKLTVSAVRLDESEKPDGLVSEIYKLEIDPSYLVEPVTIRIPVKEVPKVEDENASLMIGIGREVLFEDGNRDIFYRYVEAKYAEGIATASFIPADFAELIVKGRSGGGHTLTQRLGALVFGTFRVSRFYEDGGRFVVYFPSGAYGPGRAFPWESRDALFNDLEAIYKKYKGLGYVYAKRNLSEDPMEVMVQNLDYEGLYVASHLNREGGRIYIDTQFFEPGYQSTRAKALLAHEFFHFVQVNYIWADNLWFSEATATYFEYKVLGNIPSIVMEYKEKIFAGVFPPENTAAHGYARMPLIKYLAYRRGEDFIRKTYEMVKQRIAWEDAILSTTGPPERWVRDFYTAWVKGKVSKYTPHQLHTDLVTGRISGIGTPLALVVPEADKTAARQGYGQELVLGATTLSVDGLGAKLVAITISDTELKKLPDGQDPMVSVMGADLVVFAVRGRDVQALRSVGGHVVLSDFKQATARQTRFLALVVGLHESGKADYRVSVEIDTPAVVTPTPTPTPAVVTPTPSLAPAAPAGGVWALVRIDRTDVPPVMTWRKEYNTVSSTFTDTSFEFHGDIESSVTYRDDETRGYTIRERVHYAAEWTAPPAVLKGGSTLTVPIRYTDQFTFEHMPETQFVRRHRWSLKVESSGEIFVPGGSPSNLLGRVPPTNIHTPIPGTGTVEATGLVRNGRAEGKEMHVRISAIYETRGNDDGWVERVYHYRWTSDPQVIAEAERIAAAAAGGQGRD